MSPTGIRKDPVRGYNFLITLTDSASSLTTIVIGVLAAPQAGFSECSGLETTMQVEEYREGGRNDTVLKFPGRVSYAPIRLRRGAALTDDLWNWYYDFVQGKGKRRDGVIVLQDDQHNPIRSWQFTRGFPVKWVGPALNATSNAVAIEELEIVHEGLRMARGGGLVGAVQSLGRALGL